MSSDAHLSSNALTRVFWTSTKIAADASIADNSSTASTVMNRDPPAPPSCSGISIPMMPSSKNLGMRVGSSWAACSIACTRGRTSLSAKSRTAAWNIRSSSESCVSAFSSALLVGRAQRQHLANSAKRPEHARGLIRHVDHLIVLTGDHLFQRLDVADGDQVLRRIAARALDRRGDPLDRLRLGFGHLEPRRRFGFGVQDLRLLVAFGGVDLRLPDAFRREDA